MAWIEKYSTVPGIGIYDNIYFEPATYAQSENEQYSLWNWSGINRNKRFEKTTAPWQGSPGAVANPGSGPKIPYSDIASWSSDQYNPTELFAMQYGSDDVQLKCLVVKVVVTGRNVTFGLGRGQVTGSEVNLRFFKRVYPDKTDLTQYTESALNGSAGALNFFQAAVIMQDGANMTGASSTLEYFYDNGQLYVGIACTGFAFGTGQYANQQFSASKCSSFWCPDMTAFKTTFGDEDPAPGEISSDEYGKPSEPGGYGYGGVGQPTFDDSSDVIPIPSAPRSILDLGFINVYKCQSNSLVDLGASIFPEIPPLPTPGSGASVQDVLTFLGDAIMAFSDSIWNKNLLEYVISIHMVPGDVLSSNPLEDIKIGARRMTGILARKIDSEFYDFDFGSLNIKSYFANYVDFMSHGKLFLPFYGYVDMQPEFWQSGIIGIKYRFNAIDGSFNAYVLSSSGFSNLQNSVIAQYGGTACVHIPTTGANYAELFSTLIGAGAGAVETGLRPQPGGSDTMSDKTKQSAKDLADDNLEKFFSRRTLGIGSNAIDAALAIASGPAAMHGGGYNASSGIMSMRMPYLIIERPVPSFSMNYAQEQGLPLNVTKKLGDVHGFTVASNIHLDKINCTARERAILEDLLGSGVILP